MSESGQERRLEALCALSDLQRVPLEWTQDAVMAVLVTAIHVFAAMQDVDARDKPAHDGVILCNCNLL